MNKKIFKKEEAVYIDSGLNISVVFFAALLLCGIIAGGIANSYLSADSGQALGKYISEFISSHSLDADPKRPFLDAIINSFKYPIVIFLLGYTVFGFASIPIIVFLKGFFISFSATAIMRTLGYQGIALALSMYGIQAFFSIPCILIIATQAMKQSLIFLTLIRTEKNKRNIHPFPKKYIISFIICIITLLLCSIFEVYTVPKLVALSAKAIN